MTGGYILTPDEYVGEIDELLNLNIKSLKNAVINKLKLPNKFIIYPAAPSFHKNHIGLIKALNILKNKYDKKISNYKIYQPDTELFLLYY